MTKYSTALSDYKNGKADYHELQKVLSSGLSQLQEIYRPIGVDSAGFTKTRIN